MGVASIIAASAMLVGVVIRAISMCAPAIALRMVFAQLEVSCMVITTTQVVVFATLIGLGMFVTRKSVSLIVEPGVNAGTKFASARPDTLDKLALYSLAQMIAHHRLRASVIPAWVNVDAIQDILQKTAPCSVKDFAYLFAKTVAHLRLGRLKVD